MRRHFLAVALAVIALASPAHADDVTVTGNVAFSALDGSVLDHDGAINGVFTVTDGDLTILGTVNCNDEGPGHANACPMRFVVSGDMTIAAGGALFAENRTGGGNGGNLTLEIGQNLLVQGTVSSGTESNDDAGNIAFAVDGMMTLSPGSIVSAGSKGGRAGAITILGTGAIDLSGFVASGPGKALTGGSAKQQGGAITVRSSTTVSVEGPGRIVSQGRHNGSGLVLLEGCGLSVRGLVASLAERGTTGAVTLRSGTTIGVAGGIVRADHVRVLARDAIQILGPAGSLYALNVPSDGTIEVVSMGGTVTVAGNIASGGNDARISIDAKGSVSADTAVLRATGAVIALRSYSGALSWNLGIGDAQPSGTITLTYCTALSTAGSSFPAGFPASTQACSPVAPSPPAGETSLPNCNDAPVAADDIHTVAEGGTLNVAAPGVLANDIDTDGDPMTALPVSGPAHATSFSLNGDGSFTYVHDGSETVSDTFTYKVNDGLADSNVATVTLSITPVDDTPVATDDSYGTTEGGALDVAAPGVLANDTDPAGAPLTAMLVSGPAHAASFTLDVDGSFAYTHDGSETTTDSFTYRASNGAVSSNVATVTISVAPANDAPVANDDAYATEEGGALTIGAPGVLGNDADPDSASLTAILVSGPSHGAFGLNANGSLTYVHDGSETTSDSFTYKADDGSADSNVATVTISIAPVNDAPVANDDAYSVDERGTLNIAAAGVLGNDTDPDGPALTAILVSGPAHAASFTLNADGSFSYVHNGNDTTADSFTYRANDSNTATVTVSITPLNDPPAANNDAYSVDEGRTLSVTVPGVLGNDIDPDSPSLSAILISGPAHASSFTLNPDGSFTYVHDGSETTSDSFTYKANDGVAESNVATVTIDVTPVNDPPTALAFAGLPAQAGIRITYPAGKLGGTDVEAGTTVTVDTTPINVVNGTVTINANGSFVLTPLPAAAGGMASFQYRVTDNGNPAPGASSAYVTVSFNVSGPAIYFTRSVPAGLANCTLGNECTVAGALANIGLSSNAHIFIGDAGTQTLLSIALNPGGTIIGQGVQATSFDAFFGIVAPAQGALAARPPVNQPRPTLATTITLNNNSQVRGFNVAPSSDGLVATGKTGLAVSQMNITSDSSSPSTFCVNFTSSSGTFLFGPIAVNAGRNGSGVKFDGSTSASVITFSNVTMGGGGDGVIVANSGATGFNFNDVTSNSGRAVDISNASGQFSFRSISANGAGTGILVQNATGLFTVNGTNGLPGTAGTIQNCTEKGADFRASRNINLRGMTFTNNATVDGPGVGCARIDLSTTNNGPLNCNANLSLLSVTNVLLTGVMVTGSGQIGIDGQSVNGLAIQNTTVAGNGKSAFEDGVQISNLAGNVTINANNVFRDAAASLFEIVNDTGTLTMSITSSAFRYTTFPGNSGLHIVGRGSAVVNSFVGGSTFQNINAAAVRMDLSGAASGLLNVGGVTNGNTFTNNAQGIGITAGGTGAINYSIRENTLTNDPAITSLFATTAISTSFSGAAARIGTIDNNTIGTNTLAATASGCFAAGCDGIQITDSAATGTHRVAVTNNRIYHVNGAAIRVTSNSGSAETLRVRIANNIANFPDNPASSASAIVVQDSNTTPNGVFMTCLDVTGNQISGLWAGATSHKSAIGILASRAQQFSLTNFNPATEYAPGAVTAGCTTDCTGPVGFDGNAADFLSQQNPATVTAQTMSGGSSASQQRHGTSAPWAGTTGACP